MFYSIPYHIQMLILIPKYQLTQEYRPYRYIYIYNIDMVIVDPIIYTCLLTNGFSHVFQPSEHSLSLRNPPPLAKKHRSCRWGRKGRRCHLWLGTWGSDQNLWHHGPWMGFHVDILGLEWDFICFFYPFKMGELTLHVSYILDMIQYGFT